MSPTLPPKVQAAEDKPHHVFDWAVPARLDGRPLTRTRANAHTDERHAG
jgi:hypothetical protein